MVLEYAEKGDLFTLLYDEKDKGNKLSNERIFKLFYQICLAVDYLHKKDIMHGDLKPGNILLDRDLNVKIADFGCATKEILQKKYDELSICPQLYFIFFFLSKSESWRNNGLSGARG